MLYLNAWRQCAVKCFSYRACTDSSLYTLRFQKIFSHHTVIHAGIALLLATLVGCEKAPEKGFEQASFEELPNWQQDSMADIRTAFEQTCVRYSKKKADAVLKESESLFGTYGQWQKFCSDMKGVDNDALRTFFEENLQPYKVLTTEGSLFTGYYAPHLEGSRKPQQGYETPLYGRPNNIYTANLGDFLPELKGKRLIGRVEGKKFVPYLTREEISEEFTEQNNKDAETILWLKDPIDAFFLQIQGSGWVKTPSDEVIHVSYAGNNGHSYVSIGKVLIDKGYMKKEDVSLDSLRTWLKENPELRETIFNENPRYIFFAEDSGKTKGSLGVPLTPNRSLAIDPSFIPLGVPLYVSTTVSADNVPFQHMMMAQDTGAAITGAVRGDIFFGDGQVAERYAGEQNAQGDLFVFGLKVSRKP